MSTRTAVRRSPGMMLCSYPMDLLPGLIGLLFIAAVFYGFYACARIVWDFFRALTTFD